MLLIPARKLATCSPYIADVIYVILLTPLTLLPRSIMDTDNANPEPGKNILAELRVTLTGDHKIEVMQYGEVRTLLAALRLQTTIPAIH
jgi:hypothetical protein